MLHRVLAAGLLFGLVWVVTVGADDASDKTKPKTPAVAREDEAIEQERLARQYREFETALLNMAQRLERSNRAEDQERAKIVREAINRSKDLGITGKFETLKDLLRTNKAFSLAEVKEEMDRSKLLADDIRAILNLLLTDSRDARLKAERERIEKLLKMLDGVIREQKVERALTEAGKADKKTLVKGQEKVRKDTENLAKSMGKSGQGESKDGKGSKGGKGSEGKAQKAGGGQPSDQDTPGKQDVEEATRKQQGAQRDLEGDKRDEASNKQDKAIQNLENARKKLEERLRQLREEERQRLLAALEQRCRRMLQLQIEVYDGTVRVDKAIAQNPDKKASRSEEQRALKLSDREGEIVLEARKAIELLENDGSAVAFPEVFIQVRDDAMHVTRRLGKADVGQVTQAIEQDIITSLKEMVEALKRAMSNKGGGNGKGGQGGNPALIDLLAELKMIRALQVRVNTRTRTYAEQYKGEQASDPDIQRELVDLAQRQQKIFEVTNNIARGKNR